MSGGPKLRLFVAAAVPELQRAWVTEQISGLMRRWPEARWIPRDNQHVTLKFLGSTPVARLEHVMVVCDEVAAAHRRRVPGDPNSLSLAGLGVFPSPKRARVLWVGLDDPAGLLAALAGALDGRLAPLGFEAEKRPFSPHLTLARFKRPAPVGELPPLAPAPGDFPLVEFGLWRSHLSPKGARYERLASYPLGT